MTHFAPNLEHLRDLKDKVIVLTGYFPLLFLARDQADIRTGGANGIGAATIDVFHKRGALIVFGDLDTASGEKVASKYENNTVRFLQTDVRKYEDNVSLFRRAIEAHGRVDHALAIAGVGEKGDFFGSGLTIDDVEKVRI